MIAAIIPACNEEKRISSVIKNLLDISTDLIIVVANGCTDQTVEMAKFYQNSAIKVIEFKDPLGFDIPRAIGAKYAYEQGCNIFLFADGDLTGNLSAKFKEIIGSIQRKNLDLALTDCYPTKSNYSPLATKVLSVRRELNKLLGFTGELGVANPCHGPNALSRKFLQHVSFRYLAKPPMLMSLAKIYNMKVGIGTSIAHNLLGSKEKEVKENIKVAETIIGDCFEAMCLYQDKPLLRTSRGGCYLGYEPERRWDLLDLYLAGKY